MPMALLPNCFATSKVVPLPAKGSNTTLGLNDALQVQVGFVPIISLFVFIEFLNIVDRGLMLVELLRLL